MANDKFLDLILDEEITSVTTMDSRDYIAALPEKQQPKALELANSIDITSIKEVMYFGAPIQAKMSEFSDKLTEQVHTADTSGVKQSLGNLMGKISEVNMQDFNRKKNGLIGKLFPSTVTPTQKLINKYQKIGVEVDFVAKKLDNEAKDLLNDITLLEDMYDMNKDYYSAISIYIAAGRHKLHEIETVTLPELNNRVGDPMLLEEIQNVQHFQHQLEKRVHDLQLSQQIALQKAPQIRMIQENHRMLVEKVQSSIINTIPLWKDQFILGLTLERQRQAVEMQKKVTDTTNELLMKNSELLKTNSIAVAKENERGIVDIETLKATQNNIMTTIQEVLKIQEEGRTKRKSAETELIEMDKQLKTHFIGGAKQRQLDKAGL